MNENAKKWVEALRSGEYEQGEHNLRSADDRYCCLGVASELFRQATETGEWVPQADVGYGPRYAFQCNADEIGEVAGLSKPVQVWLGLTTDSGYYCTGSLTFHNDRGDSFDKIADIIESEPEGLFA